MDNDGYVDILTAVLNDDTFSVWWNDALADDGAVDTFTEQTLSTSSDGAVFILCDLDSGGNMDAIGASENDDSITWFEHDGSRAFTLHVISSSTDFVVFLFPIDINSDGAMDLVSSSWRSAGVSWRANDGSESFTSTAVTPGSTRGVAAADIDGDGYYEIIVCMYAADQVTVFKGEVTNTYQDSYTLSTTEDEVWDVVVVDLDDDDDLDILSAALTEHTVIWHVNDGSGDENPFSSVVYLDEALDGAGWLYVVDLDLDSDLDVLAAARTDNKIMWYEMNVETEAPTTSPTAVPTISPAPSEFPTAMPSPVP